MAALFSALTGRDKPRQKPAPAPQVVETSYSSKKVDYPDSFLVDKPHDAQPITINQIDWAQTDLPEYAGRYAAVIEHALSPSECKQLLRYVEASAQPDAQGRLWPPAMVNMGGNHEALISDYRHSDRIVWDEPALMARIMARCFEAPGLAARLAAVEGDAALLGEMAVAYGQRWRWARPNERMRFLRYGPGHYFNRHCDASFELPGAEPRLRSFYTLHLYLNSNAEDGTVGGATAFHSRAGGRRVDVEPVMGRVLIFQQRGLLHSGEVVHRGLKYSMRTDLMFELEKTERKNQEQLGSIEDDKPAWAA